MKKTVVVICMLVAAIATQAQQVSAEQVVRISDSLNKVLAITTSPLQRFSIINNLLLNENGFSGRIDSALCIQQLQIAEQLRSDSLLGTAYNWIGTYFSLNKGDNTTAMEYFFKGIPFAEKANDKRRISSLYFDLSLVYINLQNNDELLKYLRKGEENLPATSHPLYYYMLAQYLRGITFYFIRTSQPDSALHYARQAEEIAPRSNSFVLEFSAHRVSGAAYALAGEKQLAEVFFNKALAMKKIVRSNAEILRFSYDYIPYLLKDKRLNEAKSQAAELLDLGREFNNNNLKLAGAGYMQQVFDSLHNTDSAYYYSRMEASINAQIFSQNNINKIQALSFNDQIRVIEEEAKKAEEDQKRKENIQYALIALGIIILLTLYLLLSRSFITNTKLIEFFGVVALLIVFEFLNLLLHPFLERITHHNPVLMLLALVCIAALLVPLHHKVEKWATAKLVEKNKQIRLAAAKKTIEELEK
ncbi:tetratricopeptide repeat protein [Ferruginibacter sp.]|nr:hypothetical protein [Ferruginibacter sp.]